MIVVFENYKAAVRKDAGSIAFLAAVFGFYVVKSNGNFLI